MARSGSSVPTLAAGHSSSSGCTPTARSTSSGISRPARSSRASTHGCTFRRWRGCSGSRRTSTVGPNGSRGRPPLRRVRAPRWGRPPGASVRRRLVEQAVSLGRSFVDEEGTDSVTIHGDLHYQNVLAADREPWLVIDPKPMAGDPHYEVAPMLWNRWDEVVASGHVRDAVRRRFHTIIDAAGLAEDRARDWVVVRELHNVLWTIEDAAEGGRPLDGGDRDATTAGGTIAKAAQD